MTGANQRTALVTGASRGIGRAIAVSLAQAGVDVAICSQRGQLAETEVEIRAAGRRCFAQACDIGVRSECERFVAAAQDALGPIDLLVNNAGIAPRKRLEELGDDEFDRVLQVNLSSAFYLCRLVVPGMRARGFGRIVNVSSISATLGTARLTAYCASKWGLNGFTKALAEELRGSGVTVCAVMPGSVDTDMLKGSGFEPLMQPRDVAALVRYLCLEAPEAMNGGLVEVFG